MPTPMDAGYVMVAERHAKFVEDHPNGVVVNHLDRHTYFEGGTGFVVMVSSVWKDRENYDAGKGPDGVGHASMPIPGPTSFTRNSEVENAETSALGRALAMIGYHPKATMASEDEIAMKKGDAGSSSVGTTGDPDDRKATPAQIARLSSWGKKVLGSDDAVKEFVRKTTKVYKRSDLKRHHITTLFDALKILEVTDGELEGMEDVG